MTDETELPYSRDLVVCTKFSSLIYDVRMMCLQLVDRDVGHIKLQYLGTLVSHFDLSSMKLITENKLVPVNL